MVLQGAGCRVQDFFLNLLKQTKSQMAVIKRRSYVSVIIFVALIILQCEGRERFYRPDLPEQICAIGLVDIDDTLSYNICKDFYVNCQTCLIDSSVSTKKIFFEKSYQTDHSDGSTDMFSDFEFKISDDKEDIFVYNYNEPVKNPFIKIPADIQFESGRKYYFQASENKSSYISAISIVPDLPPEPSLVSLQTRIELLDFPKERCFVVPEGSPPVDHYWYGLKYTRRFAEIEFSFVNDDPETYYAIFLIGTPISAGWDYPPDRGPGFNASNFLNYELLETNTLGFFYTYKGGQTIQHFCSEWLPRHHNL